MKLRLSGWSTRSLRIKLAISVLIMTVPLVAMLIYNNVYAIHVVRGQVAESYRDSLTLNMNQIDVALNDADRYMNALAYSNELLALGQAVTDDDYYTLKVYLFNKLSEDIALYRSVSSFFVYQDSREEFMNVPNSGNYPTYGQDNQIKQFVVDWIHDQPKNNGTALRWQYHRIGENNYLLDIVRAGDTYLGAVVSTEQLISPYRTLKMGKQGEVLFSNDDGKPITDTTAVEDYGIELRKNVSTAYYLSGTKPKFLIVGAHSARGNLNLVALIPDANILANLPYLQRLIWIITIGSMIFIPIGLLFMRRAILVPLNHILLAMKKVRGGDWGVRVANSRSSREFMMLGDSFNAMMSEIQTLRVNVFEEQLNKQREELQRLQMQVNPHFFLNSLNIVYNLAKVKNFELILQMTESLIHYFRFMFRSSTSFVKLGDELEHTRNYLQIQALRFPGQLNWTIQAPSYLLDIPVPPLIVQSFVENSIKHAFTMDEEPIDIGVKISYADEGDGNWIKLTIEDTGCGFDEPLLEDLNRGRSIQNERGEHTGIWSVQRRLRLLYDEAVSIQFRNDESTGGAVVELVLPANARMVEMS